MKKKLSLLCLRRVVPAILARLSVVSSCPPAMSSSAASSSRPCSIAEADREGAAEAPVHQEGEEDGLLDGPDGALPELAAWTPQRLVKWRQWLVSLTPAAVWAARGCQLTLIRSALITNSTIIYSSLSNDYCLWMQFTMVTSRSRMCSSLRWIRVLARIDRPTDRPSRVDALLTPHVDAPCWRPVLTPRVDVLSVFQLGIFLRALRPARTALRPARLSSVLPEFFLFFYFLFTKCNCCFWQPM